VIFSYRVKDDYLLRDISIPLGAEKFILISGIESQAFGLIGGIIAGLFPIEKEEHIPHLEELLIHFMGELEVKDGEIFRSSVYLGPDPEKHLLFSRVDEEIYSQLGSRMDQKELLQSFGLGPGFVERRISSLSGGEKMKLALAMAFFKNADCVVLHGVVPWLDSGGKRCLVDRIGDVKSTGGCIVMLEQETSLLEGYADVLLYFDGNTMVSGYSENGNRISRRNVSAFEMLKKATRKSQAEAVVEFKGVRFQYEKMHSNGFHLTELSFQLFGSRIYGLVGDNGTGKSTIAKLVLRLETPQRGNILLYGFDLKNLKREELIKRVCYIGQFPEQHLTLSSVEQYRHRAERNKNKVSKMLLEQYFNPGESHPLSQLTPLELKMLSLAAFVSCDTKLIILDEPTWGIDADGLGTLFGTVAQIAELLENVAILIISHDHRLIKCLNADVFLLKGGYLYTEGNKKEKYPKDHITEGAVK
jgi:ABC-type multidrug transport system ATPase subunit